MKASTLRSVFGGLVRKKNCSETDLNCVAATVLAGGSGCHWSPNGSPKRKGGRSRLNGHGSFSGFVCSNGGGGRTLLDFGRLAGRAFGRSLGMGTSSTIFSRMIGSFPSFLPL